MLQFFSGNIGLHHVHHLSVRVLNYNLPRAHHANPVFQDVPTLTLWDGLMAVRLNCGMRTPGAGELARRSTGQAAHRLSASCLRRTDQVLSTNSSSSRSGPTLWVEMKRITCLGVSRSTWAIKRCSIAC